MVELYCKHFGLKERPFTLLPDPDFLFWSEQHRNAFSVLEYGILTRAPIAVLTGEVGAGKTTLLRQLLRSVKETQRIGLVANAHGDRGELLHWVLQSFGMTADPSEGYVQLFGRLQEFLIEEYAAGRRAVLIFDEAQNLSRETLEELRMFTNINSEKDELLQLILVGQPELLQTLRHPQLTQFAQRVAASYHLPAMDRDTVVAYIHHRLTVAGARGQIFADEAASLVHEGSGGIPRLVNLICDYVMVYAFARDLDHVDAATVQKVIDDKIVFGALRSGPSPLVLSEAPAKDKSQR